MFMYSAGRLMRRNIIRTWMMCIVCPTQAFLFWDFKKRLQWVPLHKINLALRALEGSPAGWGGCDCSEAFNGCWDFCKGSLQGQTEHRSDSKSCDSTANRGPVGMPRKSEGTIFSSELLLWGFFVLNFLRSVVLWLFLQRVRNWTDKINRKTSWCLRIASAMFVL